MSNLPEKAKKFGQTIVNVVKSVGPFLISQSEKASEEFAKHQARLASVEVMKEVMINESKSLQSVKEELLKRYIDADEVERVRIKRDIKDIEESSRTININQKALSYLPEEKENDENTKEEISDSWLDRFNDIAKLSNEPWREDLLARALAKEASSPGSVSPRTLWIIGTLEEKLFHGFAALLNLSPFIASGPMIPNGKDRVIDIIVTDCLLGDHFRIGNLTYLLGDAGLIADTLTTSRTIKKGNAFHAQYGDEKYIVICKESDMVASGVIYTSLGASIASFYDAKPNKQGYEILHNWLESLNKEQFEIQKIA